MSTHLEQGAAGDALKRAPERQRSASMERSRSA